MRIRKNEKARPFLREHPYTFAMIEQQSTNWQRKFAHPKQPLHVELGTGKGRFITTAAMCNPHINWIGVERIAEPLYQAVKKGDWSKNQNLLFFWADIERLDLYFTEGEVNRFYLHFSDPWPKKRHQKRRLSHRRFLKSYAHHLATDGDLILKTDQADLFSFTVEECLALGWQIVAQSENLHHSPFASENIMTEYEEKFSSKGLPIYYLQAKPR